MKVILPHDSACNAFDDEVSLLMKQTFYDPTHETSFDDDYDAATSLKGVNVLFTKQKYRIWPGEATQ